MLNYKLTLLASSLTLVLGSCAAASAQPTNYQITSVNQEQANYTIEMAQQPQKAQPQSATQAPAPAQAQPQAQAQPAIAQAQPAQTAKAAQAPVMEQIAQPSQAELNNRSYVKDQLYPATNDSYGRGAFTPVNSNEQMNNSQPGFTFENQSAPNANTANANNLGPENAETLGVLNGGYATERIQEVSVPILTTFDNAVLDGFKSLESGITLGMGQISNLTIDEIAPALRSFTSDADGNLVLRFSLPMAEAILKKQGAASWQGLSNPVLVWMVGLDGQSNGTNMSVVSGQNLSSFAQAIMAATPDYKYRLMFPIFDLEEMNKVKVTTILDHEDEVLTKASERYGADFFISAAISSVPNESGMTFKWNLFNRYGENIAQSSISGLMDEVASLGAGDIARALMTYQSNLEEKRDSISLTSKQCRYRYVRPW